MNKKINELLCLIAGFSPVAIKRSPDALALPATFGLILLVVSMISGVTMGYALFRVFYGDSFNWLVGVLGGLLWFPLIFSVDRLMLHSPNTGPTWAKTIKIAGRIALAVIVGFTISTPVFLRLQRNNIDLAIYLSNREAIAKEADENANLAGLPGSQADYSQAAKEAREAEAAWASGPGASPQYAAAVRSRDSAEDAERDIENRNITAIADANAHLSALPASGPEVTILRAKIQQLRMQIYQAKSRVARAAEEVNQADQQWRDTTNQRLKAARDDEHASRKTVDAAREQTNAADAVSSKQISELSTPNLASEFASAERIMNDPTNPKAASMRKSAIGIHTLFIIIELMIVTLKLTSGTRGLDHATAACEEEDRERNTLQSNNRILRMQTATEAATGVYLEAVQKWRGTRQSQVAAQTHLTTSDLHDLKQECENLIEASL